ncbi:MAG TPA: hypothetical protein VFU35_09150 [Jatrophihabitans sp.]|nr:hypothetical protein [Jatrophihabitans sp.]
MTVEEQFAELVEHFAATPGVTGPGDEPAGGRRRFGSDALKINGSIFAMISHGRLVVKLPAARVRELITAGIGLPFDAGKGRPMKEWVAVRGGDDSTWRDLAGEAARFVGG